MVFIKKKEHARSNPLTNCACSRKWNIPLGTKLPPRYPVLGGRLLTTILEDISSIFGSAKKSASSENKNFSQTVFSWPSWRTKKTIKSIRISRFSRPFKRSNRSPNPVAQCANVPFSCFKKNYISHPTVTLTLPSLLNKLFLILLSKAYITIHLVWNYGTRKRRFNLSPKGPQFYAR